MSTRERLLASLRELDYPRPRVRFLLGTDEFIPREARVGLTPDHVRRLGDDLRSLGLEPEIAVVKGAGGRARPPFTDEAYAAAGARIVDVDEARTLEAFDVVHSLKEPTEYESELRGPILRIGALHMASKPAGVCALLRRGNFAAILDGATVGSCSYRLTDGDRTPIVGSMSRFAGSVAAKKMVASIEAAGIGSGRVIIVGGGIAGRAAIRQVKPVTTELVVIEPWAPMRERLEAFLPEQGFDRFTVRSKLDDATLDDAVGIVFAHRSGAKAAEKVCHYDQIRRMRPGAAISDIAIDQGGAIAHADYDESDDVITALRKYNALLGGDYAYYAEVNMPREEPHEASIEHGHASLPYVLALLALVAHTGSTEAAAEHLLKKEIRTYRQDELPQAPAGEDPFLDAIWQDLRNGIQLARVDGEAKITDPDIADNTVLASWIHGCAAEG